MTALYQLSNDYRSLVTLQDDDMPDQAILDTLEGIKGEIEDKGVNIILLEKNVKGDIDALAAEIKRLTEKKKARENFVTKMREYLRNNMLATGISKIEHSLFNITLCKPLKVVVIEDESLLPDDYVSLETVMKPNKKKIAEDLKAGIDVPGAILEDGQHRLLIK